MWTALAPAIVFGSFAVPPVGGVEAGGPVLAGTEPLPADGDLAMAMVAGIDEYLQDETENAVERRSLVRSLPCTDRETFEQAAAPVRAELARLIGAVDPRVGPALTIEAAFGAEWTLDEGERIRVHQARWAVLDGVWAEGLLLEPKAGASALVVVVPDADQAPEDVAGISADADVRVAIARRLAASGCRVLVPTLVSRREDLSGNPAIRMTRQSHREFVYRMAYEMGRHIIGYEVQEILAAVDGLLVSDRQDLLPVGVFGYGEGGLLALMAGALDTRIDATAVSGYFGPREGVWWEPIYRNVWSLLTEFGDAEVAGLIAPRSLVIEPARGPRVRSPGQDPAAPVTPGGLLPVPVELAQREADRARPFFERLSAGDRLILTDADRDGPGCDAALQSFLAELGRASGSAIALAPVGAEAGDRHTVAPPAGRQREIFRQLIGFTQQLVLDAEPIREALFADADRSSPERWEASTNGLREYLSREVIGELPALSAEPRARTRLTYDRPKWWGYEVALDVLPPYVIAYGILLVPKDLAPGERRPVVVCQHGLEGRPQDTLGPEVEGPYQAFSSRLADRGFIVYAPQNPYIGGDAFRVLQRKANPLKLSLFSFIVRQHEQTLRWLADLPFVDPQRIGFYGLSYGGKAAVRVPALLDGYCLSISSGNFNEWIIKMTTTRHPTSYMFTGEYEMPEFSMGHTFNHAELVALIAPRPFMVERGHRDAVAPDEWVAYEYAKVRRLYTDLGIPERTEIEYFDGPHQIHGEGTFRFLHRYLNWPEP